MLLRSGKQIESLFLFWDSSKTPIEKKRRETDQVLGGEVECIDLQCVIPIHGHGREQVVKESVRWDSN